MKIFDINLFSIDTFELRSVLFRITTEFKPHKFLSNENSQHAFFPPLIFDWERKPYQLINLRLRYFKVESKFISKKILYENEIHNLANADAANKNQKIFQTIKVIE